MSKHYWTLVLTAIVLAGCVSVPPRPAPTPSVFSSPLAAPAGARYYFPFVAGEPGKLGLSQDLAYRTCDDLTRFGAIWHYDWSPNPLECEGVEGVAMIWAPGDGMARPIGAGQYLLLFNECDLAGQCNASPEEAARWWHYYAEQYPDRRLVGPNASHLGMAWLRQWHETYIRLYGAAPRLWALGVHCYMPPAECKQWVDANTLLAAEWTESGKVWVTEWAMTGCYYATAAGMDRDAQALRDADAFLGWLQMNPAVERAAWFITRLDQEKRCPTALIGPDGGLSPFGEWYQAALQAMR